MGNFPRGNRGKSRGNGDNNCGNGDNNCGNTAVMGFTLVVMGNEPARNPGDVKNLRTDKEIFLFPEASYSEMVKMVNANCR